MDRPPVIHATPLFFGSELQLFGWYDVAPSGPTRSTAIVLCPPLGYEYVTSYRAYRHLAQRLAKAGFPVLRVEYFATGNSVGSPDDENQVQRWVDSIAAAVEEVKARSGCARAALVGLRMGGSLAALAASTRSDISGLVLWEPCVSGRHYIRELKLLAGTAQHVDPSLVEQPTDGSLEAAGFRFTRSTVAEISALQLTKLSVPKPIAALLLTRDDQANDRKLGAYLEQHEVRLSEREFEGYVPMMNVPTHEAFVPEHALADIVSWFNALDVAPKGKRNSKPPAPAPSEFAQQRTVRATDGKGPAVQETALRFGDNLFGVFTAGNLRDTSKPAVLLLNTGADHHIGQHGSHVALSRDWAAQGFGVLRFDIAGVGASPVRAGESESKPFLVKGVQDIEAAIALLKERGYERVVLVGVCSGGYNSIQAAKLGASVEGIIVANPSLQYKPAQVTLDPVWNRIEMEVLARNMLSPQKWGRFFSGKIRYKYVSGLVVNRLRLWSITAVPPALRGLIVPGESDGKSTEIAGWATPGVRTHFIFSRSDPSHTYFEFALGKDISALTKRTAFSLEVVEADHNFMSSKLQKRLVALLSAQLAKHVTVSVSVEAPPDLTVGRSNLG